jgi:hypothetical protein
MFSLAYAILPFADAAPAESIRASLAPFQRGQRGDVPDDWLTFHDQTEALRRAHETRFTLTTTPEYGLQITGYKAEHWFVDGEKLRHEMQRRGLESWHVRFADTMDLDTFFNLFCNHLERHPVTGGYGQWLNPLGRWDWWDLGGRFDGYIIGEPSGRGEYSASKISSGPSRGRLILSNIADRLEQALGQEPVPTIDVASDRNVELAATLLADIQSGREQSYPGALILPPGFVEEHLRWLDCWPELRPVEAFSQLGLSRDASWPDVVKASYALFQDHWVAGIAYHR